MKILAFLVLALITNFYSIAQNEFFHELSIGTEVFEKESFYITLDASWKHLYEEIGWRRWGLGTKATKEINGWSFVGGFAGYYTFHKEINNFTELRPQIGIGLNTKISRKLVFFQQMHTEWRAFFYSGSINEENYLRPKYKIGIDYILNESEEIHQSWNLRATIEWYFNKDIATGERFAQSRDHGLKIIRDLKNGHEIGLGYKLEIFSKLLDNKHENGHILLLEYGF